MFATRIRIAKGLSCRTRSLAVLRLRTVSVRLRAGVGASRARSVRHRLVPCASIAPGPPRGADVTSCSCRLMSHALRRLQASAGIPRAHRPLRPRIEPAGRVADRSLLARGATGSGIAPSFFSLSIGSARERLSSSHSCSGNSLTGSSGCQATQTAALRRLIRTLQT